MAAPLKSPEAKMEFLMTIIASFDGKIDWDKVALTSGLHKNGAGSYNSSSQCLSIADLLSFDYSHQAYRNILKMYNRKPNGDFAASQDALEAGKQAGKKRHPAKKGSFPLEPDKKRKKTEPEEEGEAAV